MSLNDSRIDAMNKLWAVAARSPSPTALVGALALTFFPGALQAGPAECSSRSGPQQRPLVELYTSEGCSSCPPAERWANSLAPAMVLVAAFHVDYWDRLGWIDRFASPAYTLRQRQQGAGSGSSFTYTPQVLVNGIDWRRWPALPTGQPAAFATLEMRRVDAGQVQLRVTPLVGVPPKLALWWALLEDGQESRVAAGENRGALLRHEHVVRHYATLPAFVPESAAGKVWTLTLPAGMEPGPRRWLAVLTDASNGRPLQALQLAC